MHRLEYCHNCDPVESRCFTSLCKGRYLSVHLTRVRRPRKIRVHLCTQTSEHSQENRCSILQRSNSIDTTLVNRQRDHDGGEQSLALSRARARPFITSLSRILSLSFSLFLYRFLPFFSPFLLLQRRYAKYRQPVYPNHSLSRSRPRSDSLAQSLCLFFLSLAAATLHGQAGAIALYLQAAAPGELCKCSRAAA